MDIADEYLGDAACGQEKGRVELCWKVLLAHASAFLQFNSTQPVSFFFRSSLACVRIRTIRTDSEERGRSIKCIVFPNGRGRGRAGGRPVCDCAYTALHMTPTFAQFLPNALSELHLFAFV